MTSGLSSVVTTLLVRMVLLGVNFGTGLIVARTLAPAGRGEQAAILIWPIFLAGFATFGIPTALKFHSRRAPAESGRYYFAAALTLIAIGSLVGLGGAWAMPLLLHDYRPEIVGQARLFMVFAPQCLLWYAVGAFLEARGDFLRSIFGQLVPNLVTLSALLALAATHRLTPLTSSLAYAVPPALQTLVLFARLWPAMAADGARFGADVRALLGYGLRSYGTEVINGLSAQLDMAVIVAFLSPAALGLYGVALSLARLVNVVQQSVVVVLFPHASGLADAAAIDLVQRAARVSFVLSIALGGSFLLIIAQLLPVLYGPAFSGALAIMPLLTLEAILSGLATVLAQAFSATGRPGIVTLIQAGWIVVVVALLYLLVPHLRLSGAALALMLAGAVRVALVFAAYRRLLKRPFPALLPNAGDVAYIRAKFAALAGRRQPLRAQPEH